MKLTVNKNKLADYHIFLRRNGYALIFDRRRGVESFVKRLGEGHYPRLHLYVDERENNLIFNLHLDQKKASYQGHNMHNAEYDNEFVSREITNLKRLLGESREEFQFEVEEKDSSPFKKKEFFANSDPEADIERMKVDKKKKRFWIF